MISLKETQTLWVMSCPQASYDLVTLQGCIQLAIKHKAQGVNITRGNGTGTNVKGMRMAYHHEAWTTGFNKSLYPCIWHGPYCRMPPAMLHPFPCKQHICRMEVSLWLLWGPRETPEKLDYWPQEVQIRWMLCVQMKEGQWSTWLDFKTRVLFMPKCLSSLLLLK